MSRKASGFFVPACGVVRQAHGPADKDSVFTAVVTSVASCVSLQHRLFFSRLGRRIRRRRVGPTPMRFEFHDLEIFLALARCLSVTKAAGELDLTPSAVSLRLKRLEQNLEAPLFYREARGLVLSPAGQALERHARELLAMATTVESDMEQYRPHRTPTLRIASNNTGIQNFLVPVLGPFLAQGSLRCSILERRSGDACRAVAWGEADVGFVLEGAAHNCGLPLTIRSFVLDRHVVITPLGHELLQHREIRFTDMLGFPYIGLTEGSPLARSMTERARMSGVRFRPAVEVPTFQLIIELVAGGAGVAVVPRSAVRGNSRVGVVNLVDGWAMRPLAFVLPAEREVLPQAEELVHRCFEFFLQKSPD